MNKLYSNALDYNKDNKHLVFNYSTYKKGQNKTILLRILIIVGGVSLNTESFGGHHFIIMLCNMLSTSVFGTL